MSVEVESDGSIHIGAVDASSHCLQASENFSARQTERIAQPYGDDGELWLDRG